MSDSITDHDFPITERDWHFQARVLLGLPFGFLFIVLPFYSLALWLGFPLHTIFPLFLISTFVVVFFGILFALGLYSFHFRIDKNDYLLLISGLGLLFRRERHLPYATIQNVLSTRSLSDRLLGLSNLIIENASGNEVKFNALKKTHAEALRKVILQKVKQYKIVTSSGL